MKHLITNYNTFLNESLIHLNDDVDYIYDTYFKKDIDYVKEDNYLIPSLFKISEFDSSVLKSEDAKKAHKLNPITILINKYNRNFYSPEIKIINLSVNKSAIYHILDSGKKLSGALETLEGSQKKSLNQEFVSSTKKATIHHELVHWIDDTLNNNHLSKV